MVETEGLEKKNWQKVRQKYKIDRIRGANLFW